MNSDRLLIEIVRLDYFSQELDFVAANPVHVEFIVSTEVLLSSKSASNWKKGNISGFSMLATAQVHLWSCKIVLNPTFVKFSSVTLRYPNSEKGLKLASKYHSQSELLKCQN